MRNGIQLRTQGFRKPGQIIPPKRYGRYGNTAFPENRTPSDGPSRIVYGETETSGKFRAEARTLSVSRHGGMMALEPEVRIGQKLMLIHVNTGHKAECKVVSAKPVCDGKRNVAFEFMSAKINFWKMHFPVAGTKPIRRTVQALPPPPQPMPFGDSSHQ